jgi:hypothetical protein
MWCEGRAMAGVVSERGRRDESFMVQFVLCIVGCCWCWKFFILIVEDLERYL